MSHPSCSSCMVPARVRNSVAGFGAASFLIGALVILGWHLHIALLVQMRPTLAPMQYNSAICFLLMGAALLSWASAKWNPIIPITGALIVLIAGLTLVEDVCRLNLGIDQLLFKTYILTLVVHPGRMSPASAVCFGLAALALLSLALHSSPRWRPAVVGSIASVIVSIALVAIFGYAFHLPGTYGWGQFTRVAVHTAIGLGLVGAALCVIAWNTGVRPGEVAPRWLPVPLALGIFTATLILSFALDSKQNEEITQTVKAGAESVSNQISVRMDARVRSILRMAKRWEFSGRPSQPAWEADAANYVHDFPDLQAIEWIDSAHLVRWVVPLAGNESKLDRDLTQEPARRSAIAEADREHQPVITHIVTLFRGGLGFIVYVPIDIDGHSDGYIAAVFDAQACLSRYLPPAVAAGEAVTISERGAPFFERGAGSQPRHESWRVAAPIALHGDTWHLEMWPTPELADRLDSPLPAAILCGGALTSILLAAVCFYAQLSVRHATEFQRANAALQEAIDKVRTLEGLLPICSCCKRVRDDTGYWSQIDTYLHQHTNASLSHGYCPECAAKAFQDYGFEVPESVQAALDAGNFEQPASAITRR